SGTGAKGLRDGTEGGGGRRLATPCLRDRRSFFDNPSLDGIFRCARWANPHARTFRVASVFGFERRVGRERGVGRLGRGHRSAAWLIAGGGILGPSVRPPQQ